MANQDKRALGLSKLFNSVVHGNRELKSAADGDRFLEALVAQKDVSKNVEVLIANPAGLGAVARAFRFSNSSTFINGFATSAILHLTDPSLKQLYGGQFLQRVVEAIVNPPSFWNTLVESHNARILTPDATHAFAWLLLEVITFRSDEVPGSREVAERITNNESFINSVSLVVRNLGQKIKHVLSSTSTDGADGPGGRHDNDFADFRKIKILPTPDEFASTGAPFYRRADAVQTADADQRGLMHIDNQFRLLREDLLGELRNDFQIRKGKCKTTLTNLQFAGLDHGTLSRRKPCMLKLRCLDDIPGLKNLKDTPSRRTYVKDPRNKNLMKHQSLGCLVSNGAIIAFATVERDDDLLTQIPPIIVLNIAEEDSFRKVLVACKSDHDLRFFQVDTAVFAYEPVLKCLQSITDMPLQDQLLSLRPGAAEELSGIQPTKVINTITEQWQNGLQSVVGTSRPVNLDVAQTESLIAGLTKKVTLIQGPPGTGKSYVGALLAKILKDQTKEKILVLTYTNHALDQFLEDLQKIGIPDEDMLRLGSKSTAATKALALNEQMNTTYRMSPQTRAMINSQKTKAESYLDAMNDKMVRYKTRINDQALLDYLEFSEDSEFFDAFVVPSGEGGMTQVGRQGKALSSTYLLEQWAAGKDAGIFRAEARNQYPNVWLIDPKARTDFLKQWYREIVEEEVTEIATLFQSYNACRDQVEQLFKEKSTHTMQQKRIIGCTTTGAAMYTEQLRKVAPGIILVEEAGEILESHVLTAMTASTKQLILIGDHKQLRPKVNNYALTIAKGDGYDLDISLFERLVNAKFPHTTLNVQHRMRPEISSLVRKLTYPELEDADSTTHRPALCGFQDNVIFISHNRPELNADKIADRRDGDAKSSKENAYEADMVLQCVRYLGQQGYGTEHIVVLTPYLGQLYLLMRTLATENDPILNDLDNFELIRAGLLTPAAGHVSKRRIRISTIDNYQGEESDVVIVCLTRSNPVGDIGFMSAPQRVNVMLSRARNALIIFGNSDTFVQSRKGREVWVPLMDELRRGGHIYDGVPVKCERHPDKLALLTKKEQFSTVCPDGGCSEPWYVPSQAAEKPGYRAKAWRFETQADGFLRVFCKSIICLTTATVVSLQPCFLCHQGVCVWKERKDANLRNGKLLNCGLHSCPQRCHQLVDHSKMQCRTIVTSKCSSNHKASRRCYDKAAITCQKCETARLAQEKRRQRNHQLDEERQAKQRAYLSRLIEIEDEIEHQKRLLTSRTEEAEQANAIAQKKKDLENLKKRVAEPVKQAKVPTDSQRTIPAAASDSEGKAPESTIHPDQLDEEHKSVPDWDESEAKDDWEHQKRVDGAKSEAMDTLMSMIGLESVKEQFLGIKSKIDTLVRQGVPLSGERFGAALLGNSGTGKTTVARLYAEFLGEVGVLPGGEFLEISGSALANDGVSACKDHIEKMLEAGGGVFFIDEAYQLVSGNSYGGKAVLDYLLAEIENLTGKISFVLAGYHKQMEAFFAHNPGIPSRIPIEMEFQDYNDQQLQLIFCHYLNKKYEGRMRVEGGMSGLYVRIVARRIGRGRGREGFGNARDVQNKIAYITSCQAKRLRKERKAGLLPDDNLLTKEDLIGPEPASALRDNEALLRLRSQIGLASVKQTVQSLLNGIQFNYKRELEEKPLVQYSLNKLFIGSPGTGKTTVAKLYGRILADIGLLSKGEVVIKNPADFTGNVLGGSEAYTKQILASTVGKVLIIDEAYMLNGSSADPYKSAVIDTIVAEVQSTPGEDRCVLLLGYKEQMEDMLRDVNPGLQRRFPLESAFVFDDFSDAELRQILDLKLKSVGFDATDQAKKVAMDVLQRARNRPNFANAGEVDILLDRAKALHQKHMIAGKSKSHDILDAIDFDPDFERGERAATNLPALFQEVVGCEDLIKQIQGYQITAANMKALGMDPREQIPFSFLFKGPPGTGKTTTAQKMGKVYYDMGFLSQAKVVECSATDLIGQYIGQTGPKVQKQLETAMGKVLFIDEAYRLAEGGYATEAMDELVDCMTKPKFAQKLVIILAGYDKDIDRLMSMNPGLTSRFPESVVFKHMTPETCLKLLVKVFADQRQRKKAPLDLSVITPASHDLKHRILDLFGKLSALDSWGNARDVKSIAKSIFNKLISTASPPVTSLVLNEDLILGTMEDTLKERSRRNDAVGTSRFQNQLPLHNGLLPQQQHLEQAKSVAPQTDTKMTLPFASSAPPSVTEKDKATQKAKPEFQKPRPQSEDQLDIIFRVKRDPGISDAVWEQLERDKHVLVSREREYKRQKEEKEQEEQRIKDLIRAERAAAEEKERRLIEQQRIAAEIERRRKDAELAALEEERKKEMEAQKKIMRLGPCPMGFTWIKGSGGYRCAGGSHWLSDAEIDRFAV